MTASGDYIPGENFDTGPGYPVIFGIALTPMVIGLMLALGGLALSAYGVMNWVLPEYQKNQELTQKVQDQQNQIQQQAAIAKKINDAQTNLATAKKQQADVLALFASESSLDTILLDINRQVDDRNVEYRQTLQSKLASCPAFIRNNLQEVENQAGSLAVQARLQKFVPDPKASGIITDSSYGAAVNSKLKRQVASVALEGSFNQTQSIIRSLERLQPLLVFKNLQVKLSGGQPIYQTIGDTVRPLPNCQPEPKLTTSFQLEVLLPPTPEEAAKAAPPPAPK